MTQPTSEHICKSCGNSFTGIYCNVCGEKVILPQDKSFKAFLSNVFQAITFADSKAARTLFWVIRKPGFISSEFAAGRRVAYLKPLSLFFVLNLIYFLFPLIQLFNASLKTQLQSGYGVWLQKVVANKMISLNIRDIDSFSIVYNQHTTGLAKLMVMVFVVVASLPLNLLYRKKNRFFIDHVGYMVELACFNLFINTLCLTVLTRVLGLGHYLDETAVTIIFVATNLYFLLVSGVVFYKENGWRLALKSIIMLLFLKLALEIYRGILFFVTIVTL